MNNIPKKIVQFLLKWSAKIYLLRLKPHIIVIAGTTGRHWVKESVKEALLERKLQVRTNKKNFNAEIGLPLSILNLISGEGSFWMWLAIIYYGFKKAVRAKPPIFKEFLVLEMAIDRPKNMKYLLSIAKPQAVIITNITMVYQENFENLDGIALEYKKLVKSLPWNGLIVLNNDDERVKNLANFAENKVITYGFSDGTEFQASAVRKLVDGQEFKLKIANPSENRLIKINRFGNHHIYAALIKEVVKENYRISATDFFSGIREKEPKPKKSPQINLTKSDFVRQPPTSNESREPHETPPLF